MVGIHLWRKIVNRLQETISAKCDLSVIVDFSDLAIIKNLNLVGNDLGLCW